MEEDLGALERANELRNFSMQERQEVVRPANFTTLPRGSSGGRGALDNVFDRIASWFKARDERAASRGGIRGQGPGAELLAARGSSSRPGIAPLLPQPLSSADAFASDSGSDLDEY